MYRPEPPGGTVVELLENDVHVWRASLDLESTVVRQHEATLAPDERARAARFAFERDRNHFVVARGTLRQLLGKYLNRPPSGLQFGYGPQGKPFVPTNDISASVKFNISHSSGMALLAFSRNRELGIDIEKIRPDFAGQDISSRYFSAIEVAELEALPLELRAEGFYLCWTRKEAYIKARGQGLSIPLGSFSVSLTPGRPATLRSDDSDRWCLTSLRPARYYVGAVVGQGKTWALRQFEWKMCDRNSQNIS